MSVHYRHVQYAQNQHNQNQHSRNQHNNPLHPLHSLPRSPKLHSRIHRHALSNTTSTEHPLTPCELVVLLFVLGILIALVCWLAWTMLEYCLTFAKEKTGDMETGKRMPRDQLVASRRNGISERMASMGLGSVVDAVDAIFGRGENGSDRRLLSDREGGEGYRASEQAYGYREPSIYPSSLGQDRIGYADGMSESSGCVGPLHGHKEDCVGDCTLQPRRRSRES
ncbi:hypothetical protein B2J93_6148 [Marssonina coronariae]|uniref:Uncharacterized protein n=1 Tax=Diplocarpon coronariae TaxID=2795749 RepID=A0A218ZH39_9HELO|nr:hypothetical protein B2J93_6148 [Marssonina coronariae]